MSEVIKEINDQDFFGGNVITEKITLPSGKQISIRERNGEDEEILSNVGYSKDGTSFIRYLAQIIVEPKQTISEINDWRIADKYYALFKSRIQSFGPEMYWNHEFQDGSEAFIEEDLTKYDFDFSKGLENYPKEGSKGYNSEMIKPYPDFELGKGASHLYFEFKSASGFDCRMRFLTGNLEKETLGMQENNLNINTKLTLREFEIKKGSSWVKIERFNFLTSKDMMSIRRALEEHDPEFSLNVKVNSPKENPELISLFHVKDFFFPRG